MYTLRLCACKYENLKFFHCWEHSTINQFYNCLLFSCKLQIFTLTIFTGTEL